TIAYAKSIHDGATTILSELIDLNQRIIERLRTIRQDRCRSIMNGFGIGDRVSFHPDCGHDVIGTIVRLNKKSVTVVSTAGLQWRVSPSLLKRVSAQAGDHEPAAGLLANVQENL